MCGVIMEDGTQYERCNWCGEFTKLDEMFYMQPTPKYEHGLDLCENCVDCVDVLLEE